MKRYWSTVVATACVTVMGSSVAHAQESLQQVKALYASAAYEDALSMVGRLQTRERKLEFEQYRVFCLVALGRTAEAEEVIAAVVAENPTFVPDAGETSPRIQGMFQRIRSGLVPEMAQRMYVEARAAWNRKDKAAAAGQFAALVQLIDSAGRIDGGGQANAEKAEPMLSELRLLASGFLDLSRALSTPARARERRRVHASSARRHEACGRHLAGACEAGPARVGALRSGQPARVSRRPSRVHLRGGACHQRGALGADTSCLRPSAAAGGEDLEYQPALKRRHRRSPRRS